MYRFAVFLLAGVVMLSNTVCFAVPPGHPPAAAIDFALGDGGRVAGALVNSAGIAVSDQTVEIVTRYGEVIAAAESSADGRFQLTGVRPGVYLVRSAGSVITCRIWSRSAAPPAAIAELLVVADDEVARARLLHSVPWNYVIPVGLVIGGVVGYRVSQETAS